MKIIIENDRILNTLKDYLKVVTDRDLNHDEILIREIILQAIVDRTRILQWGIEQQNKSPTTETKF